MKTILATLGILTFTASTANLTTNVLHTNCPKNSVITSATQQKTQQDTIYIDKDGKQVATKEKNLTDLNITEIVQIGFYQNVKGEIEVVKMPKTIKKVPEKLPPEITSLRDMFYKASLFNQDLSQWDTKNITNMDAMFYNASSFNQDLSQWNTSNVKSMWAMFFGASSFNNNIGTWNVANVIDMSMMFFNASSFNGNISEWNVAKVTDTAAMFFGATAFNQDISQWNISSVTYIGYMFYDASSFNQNLSGWDTSNVIYISCMFYGATAFNQDLSHWNVNKVIQHRNFSLNSGIDNPNKLPPFKNITNTMTKS